MSTAPGLSSEEMQKLFSSVKAECPAFQQGCPYAKMNNHQAVQAVATQCPAFQNGCPFNKKSPEEIVELLRNVPHGHKTCPAIQHSNKTNTLPTCSDGETLFGALKKLRLDLFQFEEDIDNMPDHTELAKDLRVGTSSLHSAAHNAPFIQRYIRGKLDRETYGQFLLSLYCVYESGRVKLVYFDGVLRRKPALEIDLQYYLGDDWKSQTGSVPKEVQHYVDRINEVASTNPSLLVAHSYTRYMGDMSGGQILRKKTRECMKIPDDTQVGVAFYDFTTIGNPKDFKNTYREALDSIPIDVAMRDALVQEAKDAFEMNISIFSAHERRLVAKTNQGNKLSDWPVRRYIAVGTWFAIAIAFLHHRGAFNGLFGR
ncbi:heme oxygenase-domain-containing protein [Syncephalis plumigaleata]|nr:heme oxygenase-domain-containing protein [Syncephalis plumigaleata]